MIISYLPIIMESSCRFLLGELACYRTHKSVMSSLEATGYKAHFVAKRSTQRDGIDYNELFSPVVNHSSIRVLLSLVAADNLEVGAARY